mmetsp:Transcript_32279/g.57772  ORF Transcript_32279/g.57772 Transcript_32279/m.57772 type:complete len:469 (-) Transcript_32279:362-1768(-)
MNHAGVGVHHHAVGGARSVVAQTGDSPLRVLRTKVLDDPRDTSRAGESHGHGTARTDTATLIVEDHLPRGIVLLTSGIIGVVAIGDAVAHKHSVLLVGGVKKIHVVADVRVVGSNAEGGEVDVVQRVAVAGGVGDGHHRERRRAGRPLPAGVSKVAFQVDGDLQAEAAAVVVAHFQVFPNSVAAGEIGQPRFNTVCARWVLHLHITVALDKVPNLGLSIHIDLGQLDVQRLGIVRMATVNGVAYNASEETKGVGPGRTYGGAAEEGRAALLRCAGHGAEARARTIIQLHLRHVTGTVGTHACSDAPLHKPHVEGHVRNAVTSPRVDSHRRGHTGGAVAGRQPSIIVRVHTQAATVAITQSCHRVIDGLGDFLVGGRIARRKTYVPQTLIKLGLVKSGWYIISIRQVERLKVCGAVHLREIGFVVAVKHVRPLLAEELTPGVVAAEGQSHGKINKRFARLAIVHASSNG